MEPTEKYRIFDAPGWAEKISNEELLKLCSENERDQELKTSGKGLCYANKEIINITNTGDVKYYFKAWDLSNTSVLQSASVNEFPLTDNQYLLIHKVALIRGGVVIDKTHDLTIRVLDDEQSSRFGTIGNIKKVHLILGDVHLHDVFIFEYSILSTLREDDALGSLYFSNYHLLPRGYWFYKKYSFKLLQNGERPVCVVKKYFRDDQDELENEQPTILQNKDSFVFEKEDFQMVERDDENIPYIETATVASWGDISTQIYSLFQKGLQDVGFKDTPAYKDLQLEKCGKEDAIQKIIEYVQNNIVYIYDADVMHGHIPQASSDTLERKSGDCKAKSLLLVNVLKTIQVEAEIILVNYSSDYFIQQSLPSPFIFNHVIVRIPYEGKEYFVDPTWTDRQGTLENRSEPYFLHFLTICEGADLMHKPGRTSPAGEVNIEENITVSLGDTERTIQIETKCRKESADIVRNNFKMTGTEDLLKNQNLLLLERMSLSEKKEEESLVTNAQFKIVSDDRKENKLVLLYTCGLTHPYQQIGTEVAFKFYYPYRPRTLLRTAIKTFSRVAFVRIRPATLFTFGQTVLLFGGIELRKKKQILTMIIFTSQTKKLFHFAPFRL